MNALECLYAECTPRLGIIQHDELVGDDHFVVTESDCPDRYGNRSSQPTVSFEGALREQCCRSRSVVCKTPEIHWQRGALGARKDQIDKFHDFVRLSSVTIVLKRASIASSQRSRSEANQCPLPPRHAQDELRASAARAESSAVGRWPWLIPPLRPGRLVGVPLQP